MQADASALLAHVQEHAPALVGDGLKSEALLLLAVAPATGEDIAGNALTVDAYQDGFIVAIDVSLHQGNVLVGIYHALVGDSPEIAVLGGQLGLGYSLDQFIVAHAIGDDVGDGDDLEVVLGGEGLQLGQPGHGAIVGHDLTDHPGGIELGQVGKVYGCLGLSGPYQDTTLPGA